MKEKIVGLIAVKRMVYASGVEAKACVARLELVKMDAMDLLEVKESIDAL